MIRTPMARPLLSRRYRRVSWLGVFTALSIIVTSLTGAQPWSPKAWAPHASANGSFDRIADQVFGQSDFFGDLSGDPPTASTLARPGAIVVDLMQRVYVADTAHNRVLIWNNYFGYSTGGPADIVLGQPSFGSTRPNTGGISAATLNQPGGLAVEPFGDTLYVADTGNNRILVFKHGEGSPAFTNGQAASIVLGQPNFTRALAAKPPTGKTLHAPAGLAVNEKGMLAVADRDNNRVVGYEPPFRNGMGISWLLGQVDEKHATVPRTPSARSLDHPTGVAIGLVEDRLYVADTGNNRVLGFSRDVVDPTADQVFGQPDFTSRSVPEQPSARTLKGPTGLAVDFGDRLYVADTGNHRVVVYGKPRESSIATEVFGQNDRFSSGTAGNPPDASTLRGPTAVAIAPLGYMIIGFSQLLVFVADTGSNRVLAYDRPLPHPEPTITNITPATVRAGSEDFTLRIEGTGFLTMSEVRINGVPRVVEPSTVRTGLVLNVDIAAAEVANPGTLRVNVTTPAPGGGTSNTATLTVYAQTVLDDIPDQVLGEPDFRSRADEFDVAEPRTIISPTGTVVDQGTGRIFVVDRWNARVLSWPNAASQNDGGFPDLVIGQPNLFARERGDPYTLDKSVPVGADTLGWPVGAAVDGQGNLYVSDSAASRVLIYRAPLHNGMAADRVIGQPDFTSADIADAPNASNLFSPMGLAVDAAGNLYVADLDNHRVLQYDTPLSGDAVADRVFGQHGSFTTDEVNQGGRSADSLAAPRAVALDAVGNLYVAEQDNNRVLRFDAPLTSDTQADQVFGQGGDFTSGAPNKGGVHADSLHIPSGVALGPDGTLYVADTANNRVLAYFHPSLDDTTADVVFGQSRNMPATEGTATNRASLDAPNGVATDPDGNLWVLDGGNSRLLGYKQPHRPRQTSVIHLPFVGAR